MWTKEVLHDLIQTEQLRARARGRDAGYLDKSRHPPVRMTIRVELRGVFLRLIEGVDQRRFVGRRNYHLAWLGQDGMSSSVALGLALSAGQQASTS